MPGQTMRALAVGVVIASRDPAMPEGRYLYGWFGWQDYAVATTADVVCQARHGVALEHMAGLLGINGLTALLVFDRLGRPGPRRPRARAMNARF
ncbi:hypothetical protein GCM10011505_06260 [Tistrella bauzanensis]|uniref:Oxidoreductase N-terminal domain-containing protein n=1 Tax=Tistrella bauzanensis TaxID=657419 RepID=A0ABQ1I9N6_9PROT|nr:hypothetical protein GCM10011505_06260 [Tistrella bauzanensis]